MSSLTYEVFGFALATSFEPVALKPIAARRPDLTFEVVAAPLPDATGRRVYTSPYVDEHGAPSVALDIGDAADVLIFGASAAFEIGRHRIVCYLADEAYHPAVEVWLLGTVLSLWMERAGLVALHAGSVVVEGHAVGFAGTNGSGKSTLVADLVKNGAPLLTDDILPLERRDEAWRGRPGYPQMRMWPAQADRLLGSSEGLAPVFPWGDKLRVPVGPSGFGLFHARPVPIGVLYVPVRDQDRETQIVIEPVPVHEALAILVEHSFLAPLMSVVPFRSERFARLAQAATQVPVRRLHYPSGYEHLPRVRDALLSDIDALYASDV